MNCPTDLILNRLIDGELSPAETQDVQAHVLHCPQCEAKLAEMRMIGDIVRHAPLPQPAKDAMARWHRNLTAIEERQVRRLASWMTAAASIVLALSLYSAMSNQAVAASTPQLADWEATLIGLDTSGPDEQTTAQWMTNDLSRQQQQQRRGNN